MLVFTLSVFNSYISCLYLSVSTLIAKQPSLSVMSPWPFADLWAELLQIRQPGNKARQLCQGLFLLSRLPLLIWPSRGKSSSLNHVVQGASLVCQGPLAPAKFDEVNMPFLASSDSVGRGISAGKHPVTWYPGQG